MTSAPVMGDPGATGRFGEFGGRYIPETLVMACAELDAAFREAWADPAFRAELDRLLRDYAGRPSMLYEARRLSVELGCTVLLKREDLNHTGSHKINNVLGQALLAQRMGKQRVVAETGAGQHGVAAATAAALLGLDCVVYMGEVDMERQALNVFRMRLLGAEVRPASSGSRTLKDAINEAMRDWVATVESSHYLLGSVMGPHPYPWMVRELHRVIGDEAREQCRALLGRDPDLVTACVGGGSNAIGLFSGFAELADVELVGVEPAGGAAVGRGVPGIVHGSKSYLLQDEHGQVVEAESISAGLDYPGIGPEHAHLAEIGRARYEKVTDAEVLDAFQLLSRTEGIIPALESAHALAWMARARDELAGQVVILNLSGRGDKDVAQVADILERGAVAEVGGLESHLRARRDAGRKLLVPYITGGLGDDWTEVVRAFAAAGADAIEVGIPFSDPVMDGPTIQEASEVALDQGADLGAILTALRDVDAGVPLVVMTYVNLVFHAGYARFAAEAAAAGVAGVILPDLPMEEVGEWAPFGADAGIATVQLASPLTPDDRLARLCERSEGFVYGVNLLGVTGERGELADSSTVLAKRLKATTDLPVLMGFGIATPDQAVAASAHADGVVVASVLMRQRLDGASPEALGESVAAFRAALDRG